MPCSNLQACLPVTSLQWSTLNVWCIHLFWVFFFSHLIFCFVCFNYKLRSLNLPQKLNTRFRVNGWLKCAAVERSMLAGLQALKLACMSIPSPVSASFHTFFLLSVKVFYAFMWSRCNKWSKLGPKCIKDTLVVDLWFLIQHVCPTVIAEYRLHHCCI